MSVELPKDANGCEIPLDTVALFGGNGNAYNITGWIYVTDFDLSNSLAGHWRALTDKFTRLDPELMYLTPPDSWEKLEEDLNRAAKYDAVVASCRYFTAGRCADCRMHNGFTCGTRKTERAFADVLERIRKLRGESDA